MSTRTGPQRYPGASTTYWYQDTYGGDPMEVNAVVLHTTEGRTVPSYGGGASAPNLTASPDLAAKRLLWYQHFDIETSSRALVNLRGGVETNTLNVVQVELVGTCDPATHRRWGSAQHIFWPEAPVWALRDLARFLAWMHINHGVPLTGPSRWLAYPASYGASGGQRMSGPAWEAFKGVCGHQHVPENDHGDPGALDFARLVGFAKELLGTPPPAPQPAPSRPTVDLSRLVAAAKTDPPRAGTPVSYSGVRTVELALVAERLLDRALADGHYGTATKSAYAAWQRRCGYTGADADGIPGRSSLTKLGARHGFTVVA